MTLQSGDRHLQSASELSALLASLARTRRMVFFAGLPGVGKSLFIRELARAALANDRAVHLLQWDVARPAFESPHLLARYPEVDGVTHAVIRKAVGMWARAAVLHWDASHRDPRHLLIGEVPIIGNRLLELAQVTPDDAESLLAGEGALFAVPVPSVEVRAAIEAARARTFSSPSHTREAADAPPNVLRLLWREVHALAMRIGVAPAQITGEPPYDPRAYAAVYRRILRHRRALTLWVDVLLEPGESVYAMPDFPDVVPTRAEADAILERIERGDVAAIERQVTDWFDAV